MLQVDHVSARLTDDITCLDLCFHVYEGEVYGILGDGHAGKTELIQLLSGFRSIDSGQIEVAGCDVHENIRQAQQYMSVYSRTLALFPGMSVEENLIFWARLNQLPWGSFRKKIDRALARVDYGAGRSHLIADLDGLNQKRVHLAAALLHDPQLLLLDQPTDGLTAADKEAFIALVQRLHQEGLTIVYATDKVDEIQQVADRAAILDEGQIVGEGTVSELRDKLEGQSQIVIRCNPLQALIRYVEESAIMHTVDAARNEVRIWTDEPEQLLAKMFSDCQQRGINTEAVKVVEPSLAGVYLHLTGKSLDAN